MNRIDALLLSFIILSAIGASSCSKSIKNETPNPIVQSVTALGNGHYEMKVDRKLILTTTFLYGADLQFSSLYDSDMDLYLQSLALGHIPAHFRIKDDTLELIEDTARNYPGANHPEVLISRYLIKNDDGISLTLSESDSSVYLAQVFEGTHTTTHGKLINPAGKPPRDRWVRSFDFERNGNYFLQQTSIMSDDGTVAEFMESLFPESNLAPGTDFAKFQMDPEDPVGGSEGVVSRFRLLPGETIFKIDTDGSETKYAMATHFDISGGKTIDWWVTPNIPDEYLSVVRDGVIGWNRYFRNEQGVKRDVVRFMGRLPDGIHMGDPRFNVINWDTRLVAGAAYESQAANPYTGVQSHSLIYMPAAWVQIGRDYWKNGQFSDPKDPKINKNSSLKNRLACLKDVRELQSLLASGKIAKADIEGFGKELLKGTLFHEVGHALGLAHNFKGSLSYDMSADPKDRKFSSSIMDYNHFEIERGAFNGVETAEGPELEYDRQFLSAVYDQSRDVPQDKVMPVCNDEEADAEKGGVDPLCIRYDVEKDPTLAVLTAQARVESAQKQGDTTLAQAIANVPALVLNTQKVEGASDQESFDNLVTQVTNGLTGSMSYYYVSGRAAISRSVRNAFKALLVFSDGVLPAEYSESEMRNRALTGLKLGTSVASISDAAKQALVAVQNPILDELMKTPYAAKLSADEQEAAKQKVIAKIAALPEKFANNETSGLARVRAAVASTLARHEDVEWFLDDTTNVEAQIVDLLSGSVVNTKATASERKASATSLATYKNRLEGKTAVENAKTALESELKNAKTNASRALAYELIAALE